MRKPRREKPRQILHLTKASAPHLLGRDTTRGMMLAVLIALTPALLFSGGYFFGPRAFYMTAVSVVGCLGFETLYRLYTKQDGTLGDLSAVVTGVLLAFCLPVTVPYWALLLGDFFAVVVVKQLFGGLGKNWLNPALAARVFLGLFPGVISRFTQVCVWQDAQSAATPMAALHAGRLPDATLQELLTGIHGGSMGEVSAALLLLGGLYLLARHVIRLRIPLCYLGTVALLSYGFPPEGVDPMQWMLYALLGGGLLLGGIFMATDPVTSPLTPGGQTVYAIGCGLLTVLLRRYGSAPEGVALAILTMNICAGAGSRLLQQLRARGIAVHLQHP
ncbi:MAG: RnfABCDGE type electron transport complex subunit D [Pseudoflavonifractor sp.]